MTAPRRLHDHLLGARRGAFVLRTPFRRRVVRFDDARAHAFRFARLLEREGLAPGDRMILWGMSGPEWAIAFLGAMLRGVVVVPLDDVAGSDFAARVQRQVSARLALVSRGSLGIAGDALAGARILVLDDLLETLAPLDDAPLEAADVAPEAPLEIVFTSGTTSEPKGVVLSRRNLLANLDVIERGYGKWNARLGWLVRRRPVVTLLPLSHVYGQAVGIFVPLMMDLTVVFVARPGPAAVATALREERAFALLTVPRFLPALRREIVRDAALPRLPAGASLLRRGLAHRRVRRRAGWRFCAIVSGGAALDAREEEAWTSMGYLVSQGYGLTETAPIVTLSNPFAKARGSVGRPLPGLDVKLSADGEVLVRGANVTEGYFGGGGSQAIRDDEGFFHTGDLGAFDAAGRLSIVGRLKDVVVTPEGLNVWPKDVESVLARDARVREAAVVGLPCEGGEEIHAVLLLHGEGDDAVASDVVRVANEALPSYQRVRAWTIWHGADFPRTSSTGKLKKREIVAALGAAGASGASSGGLDLSRLLRGAGNASDATPLSDLGLSSLEIVELVSRLEGELQVVIGERAITPETTLADLRRLADAPPPAQQIPMPRWARTRPARWAGAFLRASLAGPALLYSCRPLTVAGRERLEGLDGPVLLVGNHSSYLDAPIVFRALPRSLRSRVATAMATEPFEPIFSGGGTRMQRARQRLRYILATLAFNAFPLPRSSGFRASLEYAGELADRGVSTLIFPEGRMTTTGEMGPFRGGIGILAKELRVPVIPLRIQGLHAVLPPERRWPRPGPVTIDFGEPLRFAPDDDAAAIVARLEAAVRGT